jgi:TonB family protein
MGQTITKFKKLSGAIILFISFATLGAGNLQSATGFVGDEQVEITRISNGRFVYPRAALRREIEGSVILELTVGVTGDVVDAFVVEATPPNRFEKNALKFVRSFKYEPYSANGVPTQVERIRVSVPYKITR